MQLRKLLLVATLLVCGAVPAVAAEFLLYTPRAISMGGAYTALALGPDALLWNPAGLAYPAKISLGYSQSGFFDDSESLSELLRPLRRVDPSDASVWSSPGRTGELASQLFDLEGKASRDFEQSSWVASGDKWALGYGDLQHWLLKGVTDEAHLAAVAPEQSSSIAHNETSVDAYRLHLQRYTVALAFMQPSDPFTFGLAVHHHRGGVRFARIGVFELLSEDPERLMRVAHDATRRDNSEWSLDLGLLVPTKRIRFGLVARNLFFNRFPVLDAPEGAEADLGPGPQLRIGMAYAAGEKQIAALDLDLTRDRVLGAERTTRSIALGYERWMTSWLALRSGTARVFDDDELGFVFALGTGVRLPFLSLDFGGRINRGGGFDEIVGGATFSF